MGNLSKIGINNTEYNFKDSTARESLSEKADKSGSSSINFNVKNLYVYGTQNSGNIYPSVTSASIGSSTKYWENIYVSKMYVGTAEFKEDSGLVIDYGGTSNIKVSGDTVSINSDTAFMNVTGNKISIGYGTTENITISSSSSGLVKIYHSNLVNLNDIIKINSDGVSIYNNTDTSSLVVSIKDGQFKYNNEEIATKKYLTDNFALLNNVAQNVTAKSITAQEIIVSTLTANSISIPYENTVITGLSGSGFLLYNSGTNTLLLDTNTYVNTTSPILNGTVTMNTNSVQLPSSIGAGLIVYNNTSNSISSVSEDTFVKPENPTFTGTVTIPNKLVISGNNTSGIMYYDNSSSSITIYSTSKWATVANPIFSGTVTLPNTTKFTSLGSGLLYYDGSKTISVVDKSDYAPKASPTFTGTVTTINSVILKNSSGSKLSSGFMKYNQDDSLVEIDTTDYAPKASPTFTGTVELPSSVKITGISKSGNVIYNNGVLSVDSFDSSSYIRYIDIPLFDYVYSQVTAVYESETYGTTHGTNFSALGNTYGEEGQEIDVGLFKLSSERAIINNNGPSDPSGIITGVVFFYKINVDGNYRVAITLKSYLNSTALDNKYKIYAGVSSSEPSGQGVYMDCGYFELNSSYYSSTNYIYSNELEIKIPSTAAQRFVVIKIAGGQSSSSGYNVDGFKLFDMHIFKVD